MTPRWNQDAEEHVLGAMLLGGNAIEDVMDAVTADDFYLDKHGILFRTILDLHAEQLPVDAVTLAARLAQTGMLDKVGGKTKLSELAGIVPAASNVAHYAGIVHSESVLRQLQLSGMAIASLGLDGRGTTDELIAMAEVELTKAVTRNTSSAAASITEGLSELVAEWRDAYTTGEAITGSLTGVKVLDAALHGLWPGQLVLLAARPAVGKSTLALNVVENLADRSIHSLFITLEMSRRELQIKGVARAGRIDSERLSTGLITEDEAKKLGEAIKSVQARSEFMHVNDDGNGTVPALAAEASRLHRQTPLGLIVVDYLQLMQGVGDKKADEVASISRGLKLLARRLNVPILALSQMNRNIESRAEKKPTLADLRDSGALEQDADVVMFLHQEADYDPDKEENGSVALIVAKNRRGKTGDYSLLFSKRHSNFLNPSI